MGVMTTHTVYEKAINLTGTGGGVPAYTFLANPAPIDTPGGTSVTFGSGTPIDFGTVGTHNYTVVVICMNNSGPITNVTIGGNTATGDLADVNIFWALTPSGPGTIAITNTSTISNINILVAQITNVTTLGTPHDVMAYGAQSGTWNVGSGVTIPTNGIGVVGGFLASTAGSNPSVTGFTVDHVNVDTGSTSEIFIGHTTTTGSLTPTVTFTGNAAAQIAVFSP